MATPPPPKRARWTPPPRPTPDDLRRLVALTKLAADNAEQVVRENPAELGRVVLLFKAGLRYLMDIDPHGSADGGPERDC